MIKVDKGLLEILTLYFTASNEPAHSTATEVPVILPTVKLNG